MPSGFQLADQQAAAYERYTGVFMAGSARLLAAESSIGSGAVVLDLACGTGLVARHAAALVAPDGRVVGADINPAMLAVARAHCPDAVEWVEAPCDALPFDDASFTHVICQQGLQFFPDPANALREVLRVLRPGGTVTATVWATPGHNPYIEQQLALVAELDDSIVDSVRRATPPMADLFLSTTAAAAGFDDIEITILEHSVDVPDLATWFLDQTGSTPWGSTIAALTDGGASTVAEQITRRLDDYATPDGHRLPFASYRLSATRPHD